MKISFFRTSFVGLFLMVSCFNICAYALDRSMNNRIHRHQLKNSMSMDVFSKLATKDFDVIEIGDSRVSSKLSRLASDYVVLNIFDENRSSEIYFKSSAFRNVRFFNDVKNLKIDFDVLVSDNFSQYLHPETFNIVEHLVRNARHGVIVFDEMELSESYFINFLTWFYKNNYKVEIVKRDSVFSVVWSRDKVENDSSEPQSKKLCRPSFNSKTNAITYSLMGRMGDSMVSYFHAKWLAYKHGLPFFLYPFESCDLFQLGDMDPNVKDYSFENVVTVQSEDQIIAGENSTLFVVPYMPECEFEYNMYKWGPLPFINVDWNNPEFHLEIVKALTPKKFVITTDLPTDRITVGVHVRRGGGYDSPTANLAWPLKFPPDSFYIEQINLISKLFQNQKIFVLILTDDLHPEKIVESYKKALSNPNIEITYRKGEAGPYTNILEDFFTIPKFDCLILCKSNFSLMASKLKKYAVLVTPTHAQICNNEIFVDKIELQFSTEAISNAIKF